MPTAKNVFGAISPSRLENRRLINSASVKAGLVLQDPNHMIRGSAHDWNGTEQNFAISRTANLARSVREENILLAVGTRRFAYLL